MCLNCSRWPWSQPVHLAAQPVKEEHIFLDSAHDFYPDYRVPTSSNRICSSIPQESLFRAEGVSVMTLPYYDYLSVGASQKNNPNFVAVDQPESGPKTFKYLQSSDTQGIHPPAPVYQSNQVPQAASMYYVPGMPAQPSGYYNNGYCSNGYYSGMTAPLATGWQLTSSSPYNAFPTSCLSTAPAMGFPPSYPCYPSTTSYNYTKWSTTYSPYSASSMPYGWPNSTAGVPWCAQAVQAQASSCLAMNAAMAAAPQAPYYFVGATQAEIMAQNAYIATNIMQMPQVPSQLVPFKPGSSQQFWVKELDGSWTLKEYNDVIMGELGPGHWERHVISGYYYYVRHPM